MNLNDPLGDLITRIRNAQMRGKATVTSPTSKLRTHVLDVLIEEGYVRGYGEIEKDGKKELEIQLKYAEGGPVITEISRVSKPGRRVYSSIKDLGLVRNGLGVSILSTSKGVMSDQAARSANVGGEVLCRVY
jgi:small subunit ribosomal protein S8